MTYLEILNILRNISWVQRVVGSKPIWGSDFSCVLLWQETMRYLIVSCLWLILYIFLYFLYNTNISGIGQLGIWDVYFGGQSLFKFCFWRIFQSRDNYSVVSADLNRLSLKLSSNLGTWSSLASKPSKNQINLYTGSTRTFRKQSKLKCSYKNPG